MLISRLKAMHDEKMRFRLPPQTVAKLLEHGALLVDVRSRSEALLDIAPGATNIPLVALKRRMAELPHDKDIVLYCGTGARAGKAKKVLDAPGLQRFQRRQLQVGPEDRRDGGKDNAVSWTAEHEHEILDK